MRKSSLGRRSSTHIPVRVPSLGGQSGQRTCSGKKSTASQLKQPGFSQQRYRRSQSEDRESYGGRPMPSMARSSTLSTMPGRGVGTMTPITPMQSIHTNLPTGSARPQRSQTMSTDSNRRMSSFGGTKNVRKDSRPISEKSFQQAAKIKVQQYFDEYGSHIIGPGISIQPMNAKLFVDMIDFLLKSFDNRIFITKSNFLEELPTLLKKFGYRCKIDRSWLMTVNTPHSWQHVIAVLSWLVEAVECMNSLETFEMMYPSDMPETENEDEEDENDLKIDKEVISQLKKTYKLRDDPNYDNMIEMMDSDYIEKQIAELKYTDEDMKTLQREINIVKEEVDKEEHRRDQLADALEKLKEKHDAVMNDYKEIEEFIDQSIQFVNITEMKLAALEQEAETKRVILAKKQEEMQKLLEKVNNQQISMEEKEKLSKEKSDLYKMIQLYENSIREYEKSAFAVDMKVAEDRRKLEKSIVEFNKVVAEKIVEEPRLKDVELKFTILTKSEDEFLNIVDENLKNLIQEYKNSIVSLASRKEESENISRTIKEEIKETEEKLSKETALLEGVECDLEKQQELIEKETQKLKDELNRYQKLAKETMEEMSQFDQARLEEKKIELKKMESDWELLQKRSKQYIEQEMAIHREGIEKIEVTMKELIQKRIDFEKLKK